jgi:hypothetical protein
MMMIMRSARLIVGYIPRAYKKHDASCKIARTADDGGACGGAMLSKYRL